MSTKRPITSRRPKPASTASIPHPRPKPVEVQSKGDVTIHRILSDGTVVKIMY